MSTFMEINVLVNDGNKTKPITINTAQVRHVEECEFEGDLLGIKKTGTMLLVATQVFVTPTPYAKVSQALRFGKFSPDDLIN